MKQEQLGYLPSQFQYLSEPPEYIYMHNLPLFGFLLMYYMQRIYKNDKSERFEQKGISNKYRDSFYGETGIGMEKYLLIYRLLVRFSTPTIRYYSNFTIVLMGVIIIIELAGLLVRIQFNILHQSPVLRCSLL